MPRHLTAKHIRTLQALPEALEALAADMREAAALTQQARSLLPQLGLGGMPGPTITAQHSGTTPAVALVPAAPDPAADEARAEALAQNARRLQRALTPEEEEQRRFLASRRAERDALIAQSKGGDGE